MILLVCLGAFESPAHEFFRVCPDVCGVGFEHAADDGAPVEGAGGDEAAAGGVGGASFHAVYVIEAPEEFVGVFDLAGAPVVVGEGEGFRGEVGAEEGAAVGDSRGDGHVACGGVLAGLGEAVGVFKVGVSHS